MWALWSIILGTPCSDCFSKIFLIACTLANEDGIVSQLTVLFRYPSLGQNRLSKSCLISYLYNIFKHIGLFHSCIKVDMDNCVVCNMQMKFLAEREKSWNVSFTEYSFAYCGNELFLSEWRFCKSFNCSIW